MTLLEKAAAPGRVELAPQQLSSPGAPETPIDSAAVRAAAGAPALGLSRRAYWALALAIVAAFLLLWLANFRYVYGWMDDDYYFIYRPGLDTVRDWRKAFTNTPGLYNAYHLHYFLISYLPLKAGLSLPSYPVPLLGEQTGQFRFLLLHSVFLHAALLAVWAWFAATLTANRLAALLSLLLFATSPSFILWSPEANSRFFGLPFILWGLWLLLRPGPPAGRPAAGPAFLAGSLFGVAASIHYTSLYLTAPFCLAFWAVRLAGHWRRAGCWLALAAFGLGCLWLHGLLEGLSFFAAGVPWQQGPTMTLLRLRTIHTSAWSTLGNLQIWADWLTGQMGPPLLAAVALGWAAYLRPAGAPGDPSRAHRLALGLSVALGLAYLGLSGAMPFFRQTSFLQPFLFLFAGLGIVGLAARVARRTAPRLALTAALVAAVGAVPWGQARAVFEAHLGLGRALEWAYANKGDRPLEWLGISWFGDASSLRSLEDLEQAAPDSWLISYFPWSFLNDHPSLRPYLEDTPPLAAWPTLFATDAMWAEAKAFGGNDQRHDPLLREVRVTEVGSLLAAMRGRPLPVRSVTADSVDGPRTEPVNVFDRDASPDNVTAWLSASTPMPHSLEIRFAEAVPLGAVRVVLPPTDRSGSRIGSLEVQAADERGAYRTVWTGRDLERSPTLAPAWEPLPTTAIKLVIRRQIMPLGEIDQATVEEVVFPGYRVIAPRPERPFPDLTLAKLRPTDRGLLAGGANLTPQTVLALDGTRLPTAPGPERGQLLARLPAGLQAPPRRAEAYLTDGFRRSNPLSLTIGPPVLRQVRPASTPAGTAFGVQQGGKSVISVDCDNVGSDTVVIFDSTPLETAFGNQSWLTAVVPRWLFAKPGRHTVSLKNTFGESNRLEFIVTGRP